MDQPLSASCISFHFINPLCILIKKYNLFLLNNYISKLKIIEDKRTILNILVNFFKNQKMVEKEFNATMRMYREAPRLPFWNFKEGEGHLDKTLILICIKLYILKT